MQLAQTLFAEVFPFPLFHFFNKRLFVGYKHFSGGTTLLFTFFSFSTEPGVGNNNNNTFTEQQLINVLL